MLEYFLVFCSEYMAADAAVQVSFPPKPRWMDCKHCNAQLLPDCECLTSNNRSDSDLQFALPKARSNSDAKVIKHSA